MKIAATLALIVSLMAAVVLFGGFVIATHVVAP